MKNPPRSSSVPPAPDSGPAAGSAATGISAPVPRELNLARASRLLGRGFALRCPNCGSRGLFRRWVIMAPSCPGCHLKTDRGENDYFIGSFVVNFVTAELLICAGALAGILLTWPDVPWTALKWSLIAVMVPVPVLFYPWAKTLWLAVDLTFRPVTLNDLDGHGENELRVPPGTVLDATGLSAPSARA